MKTSKKLLFKYADEVDFDQLDRADRAMERLRSRLDYSNLYSTIESTNRILVLLNNSTDILSISPVRYGIPDLLDAAKNKLQEFISEGSDPNVAKHRSSLEKILKELYFINKIVREQSFDEREDSNFSEMLRTVRSRLERIRASISNERDREFDSMGITPFDVREYTRNLPGKFPKVEEAIKQNFLERKKKQFIDLMYQQTSAVDPNKFKFKTELTEKEIEDLQSKMYQINSLVPDILENLIKSMSRLSNLSFMDSTSNPVIGMSEKEKNEMSKLISDIVDNAAIKNRLSKETKEDLIASLKEVILINRLEKMNHKVNTIVKLANKIAKKYRF